MEEHYETLSLANPILRDKNSKGLQEKLPPSPSLAGRIYYIPEESIQCLKISIQPRMTSQQLQDHHTMGAIRPLSTSSDQMISQSVFDARFLSGHNQYLSSLPFTEQQSSCNSDAAYSQLSQKFSWPVNLDQTVVHQANIASPSHTHVVLSPAPSRDLITIQSKHHGHSDSDGISDSISNSDPRERRKAQNRRSQRIFRERKENLIKESSTRLIALERELNEAKSVNGALSATVWCLMRQLGDLHQDLPSMKQPPNVPGLDRVIDGEYLTRREEEFGEGEEMVEYGIH